MIYFEFYFSKETCKKGAEREQCGQLRKAVSECDILGRSSLKISLIYGLIPFTRFDSNGE